LHGQKSINRDDTMQLREKILIVEDQFIEANNLRMILTKSGYPVSGVAASVPGALKMIEEERPDFVLLDILLDGPMTGIDLAKTLQQKQIPFIFLSANSNEQTLKAAKATRPYGFLVKPFRDRDVTVMLEIARHLHQNSLEEIKRKKLNTKPLTREAQFNGDPFADVVGNSPQLKDIFEKIRLVAPGETSVLILGETGTGKESIASCIHELSNRRDKPFIRVNCAALPATLVDSVLFGHEKGAFTGALEKRIGKFEQANGGTIFLDEVGELSLELQLKLLRVLQESEIERVGGSDIIKLDIRMIAATNADLEAAVAERRFRMDLYYRLYVFPISIPPLRDRKEDIPLLANHFLQKFATKNKKSLSSLSKSALVSLMLYDWPGNVRELEHAIERAVVLNKDPLIESLHLPAIKTNTENDASKTKTLDENERDHILAVLRQCQGKIFGKNGAAEILGLNHSTLHSRMKKLGIDKSMYDKES
jgi:two-component system, NtrC family, response regulator HydG